MNWNRHGIAAGTALATFAVLTMLSASWGLPALVAIAALLLALTAGFLHYRRKMRRQKIMPVTPARDDRVIPQAIKIAVAARAGGRCEIKGPPCTGTGEVYDHIYPWSKGGSSKDADNIQLGCTPCNLWKSDKILV